MITKLAVAFALVSVAAAAQEPPRGTPGFPGTVTISRPDYDRLVDLAARDPRPPNIAPIAAALTRADIRVRVNAGIARATMQVDGEVFRSGSVKVPLIAGASLIEARMAGGSLPLIADGNSLVAVLAGPSAFSATLEWGTALTVTPGRGAFVMPVPPAGSATATFDVPGEQTDVHISPGLILQRSSTGGRTTVEATLDPGTPTQVSWSTRETAPTATPREVRLLADVKTLVTIGDADLRLDTLLDMNVVQGEPAVVEIRIPAGYELTNVTGASLDRYEDRKGTVALFVTNPAQRRHQFLVTLERAGATGTFKLETAFPAVPSAQRETGEVAIQGPGTLAISAAEIPGLRRMDVREINPALASLARQSILAAFRYQRTTDAPPVLALDVTRFPDAAVLAAVAERAVATTLVTSEGRALTEVSLWVRNRAQPFVKVSLPPGASMLSVEVAGQTAKPVEGKDGTRVPLLRAGFRPDGPYSVSFVYLHAGTPFDKKGDMQMAIPKMDLPISIVEWELFIPDRYRVDRFSGNAIDAQLVEAAGRNEREGAGVGFGTGSGLGPGVRGAMGGGLAGNALSASRGQIVGVVSDPTGLPLPGVTVTVQSAAGSQTVVTDSGGRFVASNVPSGPVTVTGELSGFVPTRRSFIFDQRPRQADLPLRLGAVQESVTVTAETPIIPESDAAFHADAQVPQRKTMQESAQQSAAPSVNVQNLQRRAAGVLPVRIEIPRAGSSHRFIKPLVVDEETVVSFRYKASGRK